MIQTRFYKFLFFFDLLKVELYAGAYLKLHFATYDQFGEPVASFVRIMSQNDSSHQVRPSL